MKNKFKLHIIVLLTSSCLFAFWMISTPIISAALIGLNLQIIFGAPLLACGLSALIPFFFKEVTQKENYLFLFQQLTLISIPLSLFFFTLSQKSLDSTLAQHVINNSQISVVSHAMWAVEFKHHFYFLFSLALPFIFYGAFISICFSNSKEKQIPKIYFIELIGFCLGLLLSASILDYSSLQLVITLIFVKSTLSSMFIFKNKKLFFSFLFYIIVIAVTWLAPYTFEPKRDVNWSGRDFDQAFEISEESRAWTTYSKVQKLKINNWHTNSIADGIGFAAIPTEKSNHSRMPDILTWFFKPNKTLILFAGGGADMLPLARKSDFKMDITGLEINPIVIKNSMQHKGGALKALVEHKNIRLLNTEGRLFLERTQQLFDSILFSWSGASITHFAGIDLDTTQYVFTHESLYAAIKKLKNNGTLFISGNSKPSLIMSFLKITESYDDLNLKDSLVIVANKKHDKKTWAFYGEDSFLIFKKGKFTKEEVNKLKPIVEKEGYYIPLSPFSKTLETKYKLLSNAVQKNSSGQAIKFFNQFSQNKFSLITDDKPFFNRGIPHKKYDLKLLKDIITFDKSNLGISSVRKNLLRETIFIFCFLFVLLLILYSIIKFKNNDLLFCNISNAFVGFFSSAFILLMTYKYILFYGNPSLSVVFSQATALVAGGVGSLFILKKHFNHKYSSVVHLLLAIPYYMLITHLSTNNLTSKIFFNANYGISLLIILAFPLSFITGALFSINLKDLKKINDRAVPLGFSINVISAAAAAFITPTLVEYNGISNTFSIISYSFFIAIIAHIIHKKNSN